MTISQVPLKYLATLNPETLDDSTDPNCAFYYVDIATTGPGHLREEPELMNFGEAPSRARRVLRPGDTILSTVRTYLRAAWTVRDTTDRFVASTGFVCLRPHPGVDPRYLGWVAQADTVVEEIVARSVGVSYPAVNPSEVGRIEVPQPALSKQRTIADYLDCETARIDALIAAKRRMIGVLRERWQTVMHDAVAGCLVKGTTGRRGTSLAWLEHLPAHWREAQLKLVARLGTGHTPSRSRPEWWVDPMIPWITTGEVSQMRSDGIEYITETREQIRSSWRSRGSKSA